MKLRSLFLLMSACWTAGAAPGSPRQEIEAKVPAALRILETWEQHDPERAERKLHVVYWSPADRRPAPGARERLTAILGDIREFYAAEMKRIGFGPRTIGLDHADDGLLRIHFVQGRKSYEAYDRSSGGEIRNECLPQLRETGIDPDSETLVIFCNMANWDPEHRTINQNSPYYAGGSHRSGNAWQVDSPILNLAALPERGRQVRDGEYGDISLGRYNSIFIGGICHELGHALGLPHNRETPAEREAFGTALMGSGNRTYGEERRDDGRGSFLTLAHALRLASHPMFSGSVKGIDRPPDARIEEMGVENRGRTFTVRGRLTADPPPYAVIGYIDPAGGGDYDATTCTAIPDEDGRFTLEASALVPGERQRFRMVVCQANGAASSGTGNRWSIPYAVRADGTVDLSLHEMTAGLEALASKVVSADSAGAAAELAELKKREAAAEVIEVAMALARSLETGARISPAEAEGDALILSHATPDNEEVGWGRPTYDRLPGDSPLMISGDRLVAHGIYAHAPARHSFDLGGKWETFKGSAGLPDGHRGGSCVFVIATDGRERWRSATLGGGEATDFEIGLEGAESLELRVEDAGDGNGADWGMWFDPVLRR